MKHLVVRNFGPIKDVDIALSQFNLIIGLQSSGKSCVMMVACYCSWVEKRIALRQSANDFEQGTNFLDLMTSYYHSKGYVHPDTYIEYHTEYMQFSYEHSTNTFIHRWNNLFWRYKRPKVSYVPAERNLVPLVSNWSRLETSYDNILDFKTDWDLARKFMKREQDILGTGISYEYDDVVGADNIVTPNGKRLELTNSSSGLQSLIPQFVLLDFLFRGIYEEEKADTEKTYSEKQLVNNLLDVLYKRIDKKLKGDKDAQKVIVHKAGQDYVFQSSNAAEQFKMRAGYLLDTDHAEVFLEEPEINLFPPTQFQLMNWIENMARDKRHRNFFFIATHSPYVLSHLLQENLTSFSLFLTYPVNDGFFSVKTASEEEIQQIYDNGSDAFFNFESFTDQ